MDLNSVLKALSEFIKTTSFDAQLHENTFKDSTVLISLGDRTVILVGDDADTYTNIVGSIYEATSERRPISKRAVSSAVNNSFLKALSRGDHRQNLDFDNHVDSEMRELKKQLFEKVKRWEVRLIAEGLAPSGLPLKVGQVNFEFYDEAAISRIKALVHDSVVKREIEDKQAAEDKLLGETELLRNKAIATLYVDTVDQEAAILVAKRKLQSTIDAINFFASREGMGGWVFLPGDTTQQQEVVTTILEQDAYIRFSRRRVGPSRKLPLNQIATKRGFARVSSILSKDEPSDLEERILAALQWAGRAQVEARPEEAFLLYAIALESLLLGRDTKSSISYQLAVRCAHLTGGPTLREKKLVVEQILSLYDIRSNIVHSGSFQVSESDLGLMREYAVISLFIMIDAPPFCSMSKLKDLEGWFETQLLLGGLHSNQ